jgi:putative aminopeptidase FrvX
MNIDLLKRLCETPGIPGREERVRALIEQEIKGLFDEVRTDAMGSLICTRHPRSATRKGGTKLPKSGAGKATRVALLCHMDQIGFYVRHIDDKGFLRVAAAGGFDTRNLFSRRVTLVTKGGDIPAAMNPGGRPIHISSEEDRKKVPLVKEFIVDTGLPADEVKKRVRIGDYCVYSDPFIALGHGAKTPGKSCSPALDNRVACWLGIEAVRRLEEEGKGHACEIVVIFTTQEEVGLRGAKTAAFAVGCDIGVGIDVTLSCDTPGVPADEAITDHGKGFGLHVMDSSFISDHELLDEVEAVAKKNKIAYQRTILLAGGQDGAAAQQAGPGARAVGIVVGTRYIHTTTEMIDNADLLAARDVLAAWLPTIA